MNDTEALKALVALSKKVAPAPWTPGTGTLIHTPDSDKSGHEYSDQEKRDRRDFLCAARNCMDALERMLASQTQAEDDLPFMPTTNAAKPTEHMVDEALDGFNTMPATEGLRAKVEHAVERAMWACPVFAPASKSVWRLVDKWRDESGRTGIHSVLQFALMNHAIELDEALAAAPVASQMGEPVAWMYTERASKLPLPVFKYERVPEHEREGWDEIPLYAAPAAGMDAEAALEAEGDA